MTSHIPEEVLAFIEDLEKRGFLEAHTKEPDEYMKERFKEFSYESYLKGVCFGISAFAWWKDGTCWVGTTGTKLSEAIEKAIQGKLYGQRQP